MIPDQDRAAPAIERSALAQDVIQWDIRTWSRVLPFWERSLPSGGRVLAIGEREGGSSLWFALKGLRVTCTDLRPFPDTTRAMHARYGLSHRIDYARQDVTDIQEPDASYDAVVFKSVIGALSLREKQARAIAEMHRVLRPGGRLFFAENLTGTCLHRYLRKRFVAWDAYWRYLEIPADLELFSLFDRLHWRTTGLLANIGRNEWQRGFLARLDVPLCALTPNSWHYVLYGTAVKGTARNGAPTNSFAGNQTDRGNS
ncbi:MAG: class I SAM-dependent methyltransferase [Flavobacteriales bacterium]|nr:class I SAM-dependent methyltransferase [Flavobacteriales bacterium]